jgi:hypothetical protein
MSTTTGPLLFRVATLRDDVPISDEVRRYRVKGAWFELLNSSHPKAGLEFIIPLEHPEYSTALQTRLLKLEEGDTIWLDLVSTTPRNTAWRVDGYTEDDTGLD